MRGIVLAAISLMIAGNLQAYDRIENPAELLIDEDESLVFDTSLEEDDLGVSSKEVYDDLEEIISHEEMAPPITEKRAAPTPSHRPISRVEFMEKAAESTPIEVDNLVASDEEMVINPTASLESIKEQTTKSIEAIEINLREVFAGSPIIYSLLFLLSSSAVCIWLYSMFTVRSNDFLPPKLIKELRTKLITNQFDEALDICVKEKHFFCKMLASGILTRKHGLNAMVETMKAEGKRSTIAFWQRISILNEIAIIAPMLGLLGTVLGMFYAFYDLNRSVESVSLLFDGLGISVGTTVAGLVVAILAMILYSVSKYRLVRILANVENEAQTFAALIDSRGPTYLDK